MLARNGRPGDARLFTAAIAGSPHPRALARPRRRPRRQRLEENIKKAQERQLAARRTLLELQQTMAGGPRR
jgi:hypothetical protein